MLIALQKGKNLNDISIGDIPEVPELAEYERDHALDDEVEEDPINDGPNNAGQEPGEPGVPATDQPAKKKKKKRKYSRKGPENLQIQEHFALFISRRVPPSRAEAQAYVTEKQTTLSVDEVLRKVKYFITKGRQEDATA